MCLLPHVCLSACSALAAAQQQLDSLVSKLAAEQEVVAAERAVNASLREEITLLEAQWCVLLFVLHATALDSMTAHAGHFGWMQCAVEWQVQGLLMHL